MKPTHLLLAASLIANLALFGVFLVSRSADSASMTGPRGGASSAAGDKSARLARAAGDTAAAPAPADPAHEAALGRAFTRFAEKMRAAQAANAGDGKWWRNKSGSGNLSREQMAQARRELSDAMLAAFGDDLGIGGLDSAKLAFLSADKRDKLRGILGDYDELMAKFGAQGGLQLASDKEKLKLLTAERDRDVAALLSPEELADYEMRTSASANTLRNRYGEGIATEDEFKKLYALQKAYDEKFPQDAFTGRITPEAMKARSEAALQLQSDMRAAIGDDAYAALKRASDSDLKTVDALAARLNLAPDTTDRVAATRESYSAESQRIMADASVPFPQRREQLQALAARAKTDLTSTLGTEAADAYAQRSQWLSMLQSGLGFSTTPTANSPGAFSLAGGPGPSVYPVTPAGAVGGSATATRQVVNFVGGAPATGGGGGPVFFSPAGGGDSGSVQTQIISVSSSSMNGGHGPADTTTTVPGQSGVTTLVAPTTPPAPPPKP